MSAGIRRMVLLAAVSLLAGCGSVQKVWSSASGSKPGATLTKSEREHFLALLSQRHVPEIDERGAGGERALTRRAVRTLEPYAVVPDSAWVQFREKVDARIDGAKLVEQEALPAYLGALRPDDVRWLLTFHETPEGKTWWDGRTDIAEAMSNQVNLIAIRDFIAFAESLEKNGTAFKNEKFVSKLRSYYEFLGGTNEVPATDAPLVALVGTDPYYRARVQRETAIAHAGLFARLRTGLKKEPTDDELDRLRESFQQSRTSEEDVYTLSLSYGLARVLDDTQREALRAELAAAPAPDVMEHLAAGEAAFAVRTNRWLGEIAASVLEDLEANGVSFKNAEGVPTIDAIRGAPKEADATPPPTDGASDEKAEEQSPDASE